MARKMLKEGNLVGKSFRQSSKWLEFFSAIFAILSLPATWASGQTLATLPQATVDTTMPAATGNTYTVNASGDLQAALNQAAAADTNKNHLIVLQAGTTFTGNFTFPARAAGTGWIIIRSSNILTLPSEGTRVKPADAANMPKIVSPDADPPIWFNFGAHHYRLAGVEITSATGGAGSYLVVAGYDDANHWNNATTLTQLPHDIILGRSYIHGTPAITVRHGVTLNAASVAIIDSYISDIHEAGADSQAIGIWNGPGPFKIVNNYLSGSGENIIFGGVDPSISNLVPSDIEIRNNHFFKPLSWYVNDPSYAGTHWSVKNLLELKNAQRVLIVGNIFENNWADAQVGFAILFTPRTDNGGAPWNVVQDVTFQKNILRHTASGFNILGYDDIYPCGTKQTRRILIKDNLIVDVNRAEFGGDGRLFMVVSPSDKPAFDVTIDHNTAIHGGLGNGFLVAGDTTAVVQAGGFVFRNTIVTHGDYGLFGSNYGAGTATLDHYFPGYIFQKNAIIGGGSASGYPSGTFFPASLSNVGFVNAAGGDYHLATSSPYKNAGTDGKDLGADIDALQAATACVISGTCGNSSIPDATPPAAPAGLRLR
jgi:hypothetical protein